MKQYGRTVIEQRLRQAGVENEVMVRMLAKKVMMTIEQNSTAMPVQKIA